jgi:hypothetical protein
MKPRKSAKSTPVQTPPVQEVDSTIGYENVTVTEAQLNRLKADQYAAEGMQKYYRFKAWLHYANLNRWQGQRHHFQYLSSQGAIHCTCGLTIYNDGREADAVAVRISEEVAAKLEHLNLSDLQMTLGHKNLPSLQGRTIAITVDYVWVEERDIYLWTVICQGCGAHEVEVLGSDAQVFEDWHNKSCKKKGG